MGASFISDDVSSLVVLKGNQGTSFTGGCGEHQGWSTLWYKQKVPETKTLRWGFHSQYLHATLYFANLISELSVTCIMSELILSTTGDLLVR